MIPLRDLKLNWTKSLVFSLLPLLLLLVVAETVVRFLYPRGLATERYFYVAEAHEEYFGTRWLTIPYEVHPPYYWLPVARTPITNNKGFRGRDWLEPKPEGIIRIASLGDSCTLGGQESYSERLDRLLRSALGVQRYEVLNAGVGSSSTYQMLQIFERHVLPMSPDVVVVFLGWNDRWVHDGLRDSAHRLPAEWQKRLRARLIRSRLFQVASDAADRWRTRRVEQRVPVEETADNLRRFAGLCREKGIRLYLATTPDGMPEEAILRRFAEDKPKRDWYSDLYDLIKDKSDGPVDAWRDLHSAYNETVKRVAAEQGLPVIDLDALVPERRSPYPEPPLYFFKDGLHLTEHGLQEVARLLALHLTEGDERDRVAAYVDSMRYFLTNAEVFSQQFQYAAAEEFLRQATLRGPLPPEAASLREVIRRERPFFDRYDAARIRLSHGEDPALVLQEFEVCLALRPQDQDLRLDAAELAKDLGRLPAALDMTLAYQGFTPLNLHRALWIAADSAGRSGQRELLVSILRRLDKEFPLDPRARQALSTLGEQ